MKPFVSDETLNAFVDGEFDVAESEALTAQMRDDPVLAQRVGTLRSLQGMVRLAYAEPPVVGGWVAHTVPRRQIMQRCAFGCLILLAGLSGGWGLRSLESQAVAVAPPAALSGYQTVSLAREADPNRVMLHLDSAAPERMQAALDQADRLLDEAEQQGRVMQIEIVANSNGINLMRAGISPYAARMARMQKRHTNLQWVACSQTIARFKGEGKDVEMLPVARVAPTAIGEIVTRLKQGWTYVRV